MKTSSPKLKTADMLLDPEKLDAFIEGNALELPPLSFHLLYELAAKAPEIIAAKDLIATVWPDISVSDDTLKQRISLLREVLKNHGKAGLVETVRGKGYRFTASVSEQEEQPIYPAPSGIFKFLPMIIGIVGLILGALYFLKQEKELHHSPIRVALLPSEATTSPSTANLRQQLIRELSLTSGIIPIAPQAVQAKRNLNPRQLGRIFGASVLINVSETEHHLFLQFLDPSSNTVVWSTTLPTTGDNTDIAPQIVSELHARFGLLGENNRPITRILSAADYKSYLTAITLSESGDADSMRLAVTSLQSILKKHPEFHLARAFLASTQAELAITHNAGLREAEKAMRNAHLALTAVPTLAEAHFAYGKAAVAKGDYTAAENAFLKAELLMPYLEQKAAPYRAEALLP